MELLIQTTALFIYMGLGYYACRSGRVDYSAAKTLSWLVVYVANPALIVSSVVNGDGYIEGRKLIITSAIAFVMYIQMIILGQLLPRLLRVSISDREVYNMMMVFNNIGNMGFPIISALYGVGALLYVSIFILGFNLLAYTYGYKIMQKENHKDAAWSLKNLGNIGVFSCIAAIILYLTRFQTPAFFNTAMAGLGALMGPLGMMVVGISLTRVEIPSLFKDVKLILYSTAKLIVIPVIGTIAVKLFLQDELMVTVCMIMMASPAANIIVMFAQQFDHDKVETATRCVAFTNIVSVITIPLVALITL